ncbi:MAG TPA: hypothetical protein VF384_15460 [Planctomycetota bacterium]
MRAALVVSLLLAPSLAQAVRWQVPERGGVLFQRTIAVDAKTEPAGASFPEVWSGATQPGTMLAGELDVERQRRAAPVWDLRELVAQLGLDLGNSRAGTSQVHVEPAGRFQPVRVDATYGPVAGDGKQSFTARIEFDAKAARMQEVPPSLPRLQGHVKGSRVIDRAKGLVVRLDGTAELTLDVAAHKEGSDATPAMQQTVRITDAWLDPVVLAPNDAEFKGRVVDAIVSAVALLRKRLAAKLDAGHEKGTDPHHDVQTGELALLLLALLRAGENGRDPLLARGLEELQRRVIEDTYSLAVAILAIEALHTPANEWAELRAGRLQAPFARALTPEQLELLRGWVRSLVDNVDTSVGAKSVRRWSYGPAKTWDNSNTQYALLGLYAAHLCGVEVPSTVWGGAAEHLLACAREHGHPDALDLARNRDVEKGGRGRVTASREQPRAWEYGDDREPTGSMTVAGVGGLTLCGAALRLQRKGSAKLLADIDAAVRGGFLWLQQHFTVRRSCGPLEQSAVWHHYYMYGLERACELNQVAWIGGRDWYFEGALNLIASQGKEGNWGEDNDSAFGLLFLKKAALPVVTPR